MGARLAERREPYEGLTRLHNAEASGQLATICERHNIRVLTVFGSVADKRENPQDLDIGVLFKQHSEHSAAIDFLAVVNDLIEITGIDNIDVMDIGRANPVAKEQALVGCIPLYESVEGAYALAQMAAMTERMDTAWLRKLDLALMAEGT